MSESVLQYMQSLNLINGKLLKPPSTAKQATVSTICAKKSEQAKVVNKQHIHFQLLQEGRTVHLLKLLEGSISSWGSWRALSAFLPNYAADERDIGDYLGSSSLLRNKQRLKASGL